MKTTEDSPQVLNQTYNPKQETTLQIFSHAEKLNKTKTNKQKNKIYSKQVPKHFQLKRITNLHS